MLLLGLALAGSAPAQSQELPGAEPAAEPPRIAVQDVPEDSAIQRRLAAVLQQIDGLEDVRIEVESGVVTVSGSVPNARSTREVLDLARRTEGVLFVEDRLEEEIDLRVRLRPAAQKFRELGASALRILPVALVAIAVVVLFWFLGRLVGNRGRWLKRFGLTDLSASLGRRVARTVVTGAGVLIALEILDATAVVGALLGVAGVAGIALGFAFRNIVENYLAGVLLSARNPFGIGDQVQVGEFVGKVVRLTSRDTVLMTLDGNHLRIPNSVIITSAMTNFSRNPLRRFEFQVGVSVDLDLVAARDLGAKTLRRMRGVLSNPGPQGLITDLGDSTVQLCFLAWIDQRDSDYLKARSEAIRLVKTAFDDAGLEMPEPIYRVHLREAGAVRTGTGAPAKLDAEKPEAPPPSARAEDADVGADRTIDEQVADELLHSDEENLLKRER
jgi:small-conductance mechanosensitive channel